MTNHQDLVPVSTSVELHLKPVTAEITNFDISIFEIDKTKGMVNLTKIAKYFSKEVYDWKRLPSTKDFLEAMQENEANRDILVSVKGGDLQGLEQGTWATEEVAIEFAQWISPKFKVFCIKKLRELFQNGTVSILAKTEEELLLSLFPSADSNLIHLTAQNIREVKTLSLQVEQKELVIDNLSTVFNHQSKWISILKVAIHNKVSEKEIKYQTLKKKSKELGYEVKKFPSRRYGFQNGYHVEVFQASYPALRYDFTDLAVTNLTLTSNL